MSYEKVYVQAAGQTGKSLKTQVTHCQSLWRGLIFVPRYDSDVRHLGDNREIAMTSMSDTKVYKPPSHAFDEIPRKARICAHVS